MDLRLPHCLHLQNYRLRRKRFDLDQFCGGDRLDFWQPLHDAKTSRSALKEGVAIDVMPSAGVVRRPSHSRPTARGPLRRIAVTQSQGLTTLHATNPQVRAHSSSHRNVPSTGLEPVAYRLGGSVRPSETFRPVR